MYIDIQKDFPEIHPTKICIKCYARLGNLKIRGCTSTHTLVTWEEHKDDCNICENIPNKRKGGRPKKKQSTGRYSEKNSFWTRGNSAVSDRTISPGELAADVKVDMLNKEHNSHLNLCCPICANIMNRPV